MANAPIIERKSYDKELAHHILKTIYFVFENVFSQGLEDKDITRGLFINYLIYHQNPVVREVFFTAIKKINKEDALLTFMTLIEDDETDDELSTKALKAFKFIEGKNTKH